MARTVVREKGETRPETAESDSLAESAAPSHQDIAQLAFSLWEARGGAGGSAEEDWFEAERELQRNGAR